MHAVARTRILLAGLALGVAACALQTTPASAYCDDETHPCTTECDTTAATVNGTVEKTGLPYIRYDLIKCPQN